MLAEELFMERVEIVGALAAFTSTIALLRQITKAYSTRETKDLSLLMLVNFLVTSLLWVWYGIMIGSASVWVCNIFGTGTAVSLLALKQRFG